VIDVGQAVTLDHPRAGEGSNGISRTSLGSSRRLRVDVTPATLERAITGE